MGTSGAEEEEIMSLEPLEMHLSLNASLNVTEGGRQLAHHSPPVTGAAH